MAHKKRFGGFRLPGMVSVGKNVSSGLSLTEDLQALIRFSTSSFVKVTVDSKALDGERHECTDNRKAEAKLNEVRAQCSTDTGSFFLLFGYEEIKGASHKKCLLVSYIPENLKVRSKMLLSTSVGTLKASLEEKLDDCVIEEFACTELKEVSEEIYTKRANVEKPFTAAERARMEEDSMEKVEGDNILARLRDAQKNAPAYALPGFGIGMKPSEVKKDRIQSMNVAREKDGQRNAKVDFMLQLKEEKRKMEQEMREQEQKEKEAAKMREQERESPERKSDGAAEGGGRPGSSTSN